MIISFQDNSYTPVTILWMSGIYFVNEPLDAVFLIADGNWLIIKACPV
jgi:hypothetical protein